MLSVVEQTHLTNFLLDLENWAFKCSWDSRLGVPGLRFGKPRHEDQLWKAVMLEALEEFPRRRWDDYVRHVTAGYGDDWFFAERPECTCRTINGHTLADDPKCGCATINGQRKSVPDL